ncbi:MAG: transferrin receptor-like dimerization domain-containing protein, partial [Terriglobia bacterium]
GPHVGVFLTLIGVFEFEAFSATVGRYLDEIEKLPNQRRRIDLGVVRGALAQLMKTAADFNASYDRALAKVGSGDAQKLAAINETLYRSERDLTLDPGLPGRPWFRHRIYAPGQYTGYAVKTLPGIREAVEAGKAQEADQQAEQVAEVLRALSTRLKLAAKMLGDL